MTAMDVIEHALGEVADVLEYRGTYSALLGRINRRQQQLFAEAAKANPDWNMAHAVAPVVQGRFSLSDLIFEGQPIEVSLLERVVLIEVEDSGVSLWGPGTKITVVPRDDPDMALPPRVVSLGRELRSVGGDLAGVDHVRVYYARRPATVRKVTDVVEVPEPYTELLSLDLARYMLRRSGKLDEQGERVGALLADEEKELATEFLEYVSTVVGTERRFHG